MTVNKKYYDSVDILKVVLMACMILSGYVISGEVGSYISYIVCFAGGAFFTLYGYFILYDIENDDSRLRLSIRRLFLAFVICALVYFTLVALELGFEKKEIQDLFTKRFIFNFLVMNYWVPSIGFNIFYIHAALYAAVICYFANKLKLMRYSLPVMVILFLIATVFGEGAKLIHFNVLDYSFIPGTFLTRALPYMLLGRVLHTDKSKLLFSRLKGWVWVAVFTVGVMLCFLEIVGLTFYDKAVYLNHLVGFIPMTVAVCVLALRSKRTYWFARYCKDIYRAMFYIYTIIGETVYAIIVMAHQEVMWLISYLGFITLLLSLLAGVLYCGFKHIINRSSGRKGKKHEIKV